MRRLFLPERYSLLRSFISLFLLTSFIIRIIFIFWNFNQTDLGIFNIIKTLGIGLCFDIGTLSFFLLPYFLYLLVWPNKWVGTTLDKVITYVGFSLNLIILYFSAFGEITFWDEFQRRYNFIAVDYLIYTYEVVKNINESYPIPLLLSGIIIIIVITYVCLNRLQIFKKTFASKVSIKKKLMITLPWMTILAIFSLGITNEQAEWSTNRYNNEISKSGIYSFFAAFRNNELAYTDFYETIPQDQAFSIVQNRLEKEKIASTNIPNNSILRKIESTKPLDTIIQPNVIFICIESLSGKFLNSLGGTDNITPNLDSLASESIFFSNLYATGTRTVRGMEAITLSIPPTPGRSIVKRQQNTGLFTIGTVFKNQGYNCNFFYGGDGYFDNMNTYFGGNGFNIIDRGRGFLLDKSIKTKRINIEDHEVTFENAWGVCDEDIYNKVLKEADKAYSANTRFFDFVMTTSNHKPYTYPENKIDIPSGTGRKGAVKYTDYAIGKFIEAAKTKPWFSNTVFVIMSDHCASSAGRWELDINNYKIPAIIYNLPKTSPVQVNTLCSQIDLFPTLFNLFGWTYESNLFGVDVFQMKPNEERAFVGNYRKLGLLKDKHVMVLGDQKNNNFYTYDKTTNNLKLEKTDPNFLLETVAWYQVADYLYQHNGLKGQ